MVYARFSVQFQKIPRALKMDIFRKCALSFRLYQRRLVKTEIRYQNLLRTLIFQFFLKVFVADSAGREIQSLAVSSRKIKMFRGFVPLEDTKKRNFGTGGLKTI